MSSSMAKKAKISETGQETELKKELQRQVKVILEEDDCSIDTVIKTIRILSRLTEMKLSQSVGTVSSSEQEQILSWCEEHGVSPRKFDRDIGEPVTDRCYVNSLLEKFSSSLSDQKEAAKELHRLTKTMPSCRAVFSELPDGISRLISPLSVAKIDSDPELQEDLIATVLNISTVDDNKRIVAEHPDVIPLLAASMSSGTIATLRNAAATLFTLSKLDSNKIVIGISDALKPLLELLLIGHPLVLQDAVPAIFSLCHVLQNIVKFTELGAVKVILKKLTDGIHVDELLEILALLSKHPDAMDDLEEPKTFRQFLQIMKTYKTESNKESCNTIMCHVITGERR